jgi:putative transposase
MILGIKSTFTPRKELGEILTQWIGCARVVYTAKCDEDKYLRTFAKKYLPVGTWPEINKSYSQFKTDLTPWLKVCPSQILRNSATIWYHTYQRFFKGLGGRPKRKTRVTGDYIWLTSELFRIRWEGRVAFVEIGTVKNPVGVISVRFSRKRLPSQNPKSIWIRKTNAGWTLSFSYDNGIDVVEPDNKEHLRYLQRFDEPTLAQMITPVDRGVARPVQTDAEEPFQFTDREKAKFRTRDKLVRRFQRQMARQKKGSNRRKVTLKGIGKLKGKDKQVRENFWHQTTRKIVNHSKVVVIEDLKLKNMTRRPKAKVSSISGQWEKNGAKAKAGLNRAMLGVGLGQFEQFLSYKLAMANKPLFKVSPHHTSQECANCGHTHPSNRTNQSDFKCVSCGHTDNADHNAALVIRKRAVNLILNSGTELVGAHQNVLRLRANANPSKTTAGKPKAAVGCSSKKKAA